MGKLQFHRRWKYFHTKGGRKNSESKRIKPFHRRINNRNHYLFYETQAIRKENWKVKESSSEQEHKVNALAQGAEEGRDKLR